MPIQFVKMVNHYWVDVIIKNMFTVFAWDPKCRRQVNHRGAPGRCCFAFFCFYLLKIVKLSPLLLPLWLFYLLWIQVWAWGVSPDFPSAVWMFVSEATIYKTSSNCLTVFCSLSLSKSKLRPVLEGSQRPTTAWNLYKTLLRILLSFSNQQFCYFQCIHTKHKVEICL